jgi:hypothetical protein
MTSRKLSILKAMLRIRIILGSWIRIHIRIRIKVKSRTRIPIKVKIQDQWRLKLEQLWAIDAHNGGVGRLKMGPWRVFRPVV